MPIPALRMGARPILCAIACPVKGAIGEESCTPQRQLVSLSLAAAPTHVGWRKTHPLYLLELQRSTSFQTENGRNLLDQPPEIGWTGGGIPQLGQLVREDGMRDERVGCRG